MATKIKPIYQVKHKTENKYVGLVNFGRTYRWCASKCTLSGIDQEKAKQIAKAFDGELTEMTFLPVVIGNEGYGWDIYSFCESIEEAKQTLRDYRENVKNGTFNISWRWSRRYIAV